MNNLAHLFREYPAVVAMAFFALITALLGTIFTVAMLKSGASLKPLIFIGCFFAIVVGPQGAVHLLDAWAHRKAVIAQAATPGDSAADAATNRGSSAAGVLQPVAWSVVFGPKADPMLITDAKRGLTAILGEATEAKLSFNADGESALAARFATREAAENALNVYGRFFNFSDVTGSDAAGWTARRYAGQGEWNHVVAAGNELYAWTGATREAVIANRERALGALPSGYADLVRAGSGAATKAIPKEAVSNRLRANKPVVLTMVVLNVLVAVLWFFKGSAWAARVPAAPIRFAAEPSALIDRISALAAGDSLMQVAPGADRNSLEITWRTADARWIDLARVHQLKRVQKLVLTLDAAGRRVRVQEYWSAFNASAGFDGARATWTAAAGMQFFAVEHTRIVGAQLDVEGRPTGELSRTIHFNLQELKRPVIDAVTSSGWTWQPAMWNAPAAFRWLTE